jgi:hypothetical protein
LGLGVDRALRRIELLDAASKEIEAIRNIEASLATALLAGDIPQGYEYRYVQHSDIGFMDDVGTVSYCRAGKVCDELLHRAPRKIVVDDVP